MSIEVRIPKEIKDYKEKIIFGLSFRQLISVAIGGVVCLGTYFIFKKLLGSNIASDIIIIEAIPIFAFGFIKIKGLNFEKYVKLLIKHKFSTKKRIYETKVKNETIKKIDNREVKNIEFVKNKKCECLESGTKGRINKNKEIKRRIKRAKKEFKEKTKRGKTIKY